jgi:hypothetical protein
MRRYTKVLVFIIGLMIGWSLGGCSGPGPAPGSTPVAHTPRTASSHSRSTAETVTVRRIYESPYGYHLYQIDRPGHRSSFAQPIYRNPASGSTVWRVD